MMSAKSVKITTAQTKSKVLTYASGRGIERLDSLRNGTYMVKMDSENPLYVFYVAKKGYRRKTILVGPDNINPGRILNIFAGAGAITLGALFLANDVVGEGAVFTIAGVLMVGSGVIGGRSSINKVYDSKYKLPELQQYVKRDSAYPFLFIDTVSVRIPGRICTSTNYLDYKSYKKNIPLKMAADTASFNVDLTIKNDDGFNLDLNSELYENGYMDTTVKLFRSRFGFLRIRFSVNRVHWTFVEQVGKADGSVNIEVFDFVDTRPKYVFTTEAESIWIPGSSTSERVKSNIACDLFADAAHKFFADPEARTRMRQIESKNVQETKAAETIELDTTFIPEQKLNVLAKAVYTVLTPRGHGSACMISKDGYLLTNYHVTLNDTTKCRLMLADGKKIPYKIIRLSPANDLALIKVEGHYDHVLSTGGQNADLGDEVYAIGTPGDVELGQSISKGIISSFRKFEGRKYIQTDVKINPGNSGGALVNMNGELIGIVSSKIIGLGTEGLGFAIPVNEAVERLKLKLN